jgi:hypothetical protein
MKNARSLSGYESALSVDHDGRNRPEGAGRLETPRRHWHAVGDLHFLLRLSSNRQVRA